MPEKKAQNERPKEAGTMTVQEAGRMGGHKGGQRVKELIEEGKRSEAGSEPHSGGSRRER